MTRIQQITDEHAARALADLLNGDSRRRPVVVITTPSGQPDPWIDVDEVAREAGDLAEVYLMATGPFTWEFSNRMAEGTQVYGGAGRAYPVGHEWALDLGESPLRFAFNAKDGERATQQLVSDALRMAAAAGVQATPGRNLRKVSGVVQLVVAGRALVDVGARLPASIAEELTVEGVSIDRILTVGQIVDGWYDAETGRLDVRESVQAAEAALAHYSVGDVVLSEVAAVRNGKAELVLYPKTASPAVVVTVLRADVTLNPADDLRTLMTTGEILPARIESLRPNWVLRLNDIDDVEPIVGAPALLRGGPPWLVEEVARGPADEDKHSVLPPAQVRQQLAKLPAAPPLDPSDTPRTAPIVVATPSPALLDRNRAPASAPRGTAAPVGEHSGSTKSLLLKIDGLAGEVRTLKRQVEHLTGQVVAGTDESAQLRYLLDQAERRANRDENELKSARARLRKAGSSKSASTPASGPQFRDQEQGFRYMVLTQWATRIPLGEQATRALPDYVIGPRFLASLINLEGVSVEKVADVVVEIITGLAPQLPGREVHRLRTGRGGEDPVRTREDGAVAWRASLQVKSASARRIHYWILPSGQVELGRVAIHDDFDA